MVLALGISAAGASSGGALGHDVIKWPELLPPLPVSSGVQAHPVRNCRQASIKCVNRLVRKLRKQLRRFDGTCDHRAVIAYSYLQITKGLRDDLRKPRPDLVRHRRWMTYVLTAFSNRYLRSFRRDAHGGWVAPAWRKVFEAADSGDANAGQDTLLFSNAHVQHDLPFVYEQMGMKSRSGTSFKADHDAVNEVNANVFDRIEKRIAGRYDPTFEAFDLPVPLEEFGVLELVKSWREGAWRNGERLLNASTPADRHQVIDSINQTSILWANLISAGGLPGTRAQRDAYCAAQR